MMLVFATAAAIASAPAVATGAVAAARFDLARPANRAAPRDQAASMRAVPPKNLDLRDFAVDAPELELPLAENGPRLLVGAFGGRGKGMPKLAHVGLGWTF